MGLIGFHFFRTCSWQKFVWRGWLTPEGVVPNNRPLSRALSLASLCLPSPPLSSSPPPSFTASAASVSQPDPAVPMLDACVCVCLCCTGSGHAFSMRCARCCSMPPRARAAKDQGRFQLVSAFAETVIYKTQMSRNLVCPQRSFLGGPDGPLSSQPNFSFRLGPKAKRTTPSRLIIKV